MLQLSKSINDSIVQYLFAPKMMREEWFVVRASHAARLIIYSILILFVVLSFSHT